MLRGQCLAVSFMAMIGLMAAACGGSDGSAPQVSSPPPPLTKPTGAPITATAETEPVPNAGDAADDPAIWVDPTDPARSTVIGTDKLGGLAVYDLNGEQLHYYDVGRINNVDIRSDVTLNGNQISLVAGSERDSDEIRFFEVDPSTRGLRPVGSVSSNLGVAGLCLFRDPSNGRVSAFVGDSSGSIEQWELSTSGNSVSGTQVRTIRLDTTTEGCVVDDDNGYLYVSEEDKGIWRYPARAKSAKEPVMIARTTENGGSHLQADIEGLAVWNGADRGGYLVASSQANDSFVVYDRLPPNNYVATFQVESGTYDGVDHSDGIAITSADLGGLYGSGMFVVQDDTNGSKHQNFKLVSWADIATSAIGVPIAASD